MTSWRDAGALLQVITLANIAGVLWSEAATLWVWALYLIGLVALGYLASRRSDRRIRAVRDAVPADRAAKLATS